jgi:hypothetical protein
MLMLLIVYLKLMFICFFKVESFISLNILTLNLNYKIVRRNRQLENNPKMLLENCFQAQLTNEMHKERRMHFKIKCIYDALI